MNLEETPTFEAWKEIADGLFDTLFDEYKIGAAPPRKNGEGLGKMYANWSKEKTRRYLFALMRAAYELKEEAGVALTFRSSLYRMSDRGELGDRTVDSMQGNLNNLMSRFRDAGLVPWGLFSDDSGDSRRGMTPEELEAYIKDRRENNVPPSVIDGKLYALYIEKTGLIPFFRRMTNFALPVGSPGGNIRKSWAYGWITEMRELATRLGAELVVVYMGDGEPGKSKGWAIREETRRWLKSQFEIDMQDYAVTPEDVARIGREIHLDGWIEQRGVGRFAEELRAFLGMHSSEDAA